MARARTVDVRWGIGALLTGMSAMLATQMHQPWISLLAGLIGACGCVVMAAAMVPRVGRILFYVVAAMWLTAGTLPYWSIR